MLNTATCSILKDWMNNVLDSSDSKTCDDAFLIKTNTSYIFVRYYSLMGDKLFPRIYFREPSTLQVCKGGQRRRFQNSLAYSINVREGFDLFIKLFVMLF